MRNALLQWILSALAIWIVSQIIPGFVVASAGAALIAAIVIGFVNGTLGFVLKLVTFPLTVMTLGLFWLVINAVVILLSSMIIPGFEIETFAAAFFGGIILSIINMIFGSLVK